MVPVNLAPPLSGSKRCSCTQYRQGVALMKRPHLFDSRIDPIVVLEAKHPGPISVS